MIKRVVTSVSPCTEQREWYIYVLLLLNCTRCLRFSDWILKLFWRCGILCFRFYSLTCTWRNGIQSFEYPCECLFKEYLNNSKLVKKTGIWCRNPRFSHKTNFIRNVSYWNHVNNFTNWWHISKLYLLMVCYWL